MSKPKRAPTPLHAPAPRYKCECENLEHFGGIKHPYGCGLEVVEKVENHMGTFHICPACRANCGFALDPPIERREEWIHGYGRDEVNMEETDWPSLPEQHVTEWERDRGYAWNW